MAGQTVTISVLADTKRFSSAFRNLSKESGLSKLGDNFKRIAKATAVGVAAVAGGAVVLGKKAADAASSLQQSMGGVDAIFKNTADQVHKYAKGAADNLGLSKNSYNELAAIIGTTLKNSGTPLDKLAAKTNNLIGVSADLAATFGGPVTDASAAMASALRGEFEPLRKYGVSLSQADIVARALADTNKKSASDLTKNEKALATQALILDQSADASGAFAREANTLAGQQERLKAKLENVAATVGSYLLPFLTKLVTVVSRNLGPAFDKVSKWVAGSVVPAFKALAGWFADNRDVIAEVAARVRDALGKALSGLVTIARAVASALMAVGEWIVKNRDWLIPLAAAVGAMVLAWQGYLKVMAIWKAAVATWTAAQAVLNAVMAANPIGLVVLAVVGLVTAIGVLWNTNEGFRDAVTKVWTAIQNAFTVAIDAIKSAASAVWDFLKKVFSWHPLAIIVRNWDKITGFFGSVGSKIKAVFSGAIEWLTSAGRNIISGLRSGIVDRWNAVVTWFRERGAAVKGFFSAAIDWLLSSGRSIISGLRSGITERWTAVIEWFRGRPEAIKNTLSNAANWLLSAGKDTISGFISGIKSMAGSIITAIKNTITDKLPGFVKTALGIRSPSRVFMALGKFIPLGMAAGIAGQAKAVTRAMGDVVSKVTDVDLAKAGALAARDFATGASGAGLSTSLDVSGAARAGGVAYHVTVQTLNPTAEVGRLVLDSIRQHERMNGRR